MKNNSENNISKEMLNLQNFTINDGYSWIRDKSWPQKISDSKVCNLIQEENENFHNFISELEPSKQEFYQELKSRIKLSDQSTYIKRDNYFYYSKTQKDKDYPLYCRKKFSMDDTEEVFLDVNIVAEGKDFCRISDVSVSPNHKFLVYSADFIGDERYHAVVIDLENKQYLSGQIADVTGNFVWSKDNKGFFYTKLEQNWKHLKVFYHKLKDKHSRDILIFQEKQDIYFVSITKSSDKNFLFINVGGHQDNEIFFINLNLKLQKPTLIKERTKEIFYDIDSCNDYFYLKINKENSRDFGILRSKNTEFSANFANWELLIPYDKEKYLASFDITEKYLILNYKFKASPLIYVHDLKNLISKEIKFPEESFTACAYSTNFFENDIRVIYSSLKSPKKIFSYSFDDDTLYILKEQKIPSGFNSQEYEVKKIFTKIDNVEVPVTILYKKSLFNADGSNYLYLNGYGAYGISNTTDFKNSAISIVNMGIIYAIAHIRGGSELGYEWYINGKFLDKKNSFQDFIAVTEDLINKKYSSENKILISGGSAGGMLIGNVINQKSHYYKAAILHVPFVDVLNTMMDESLPLTTNEFKEWGNPKEKKFYEYIKSYCPYQNIKKQPYPHIFATTGTSDIRVGYWEALKWVRKIKDNRTNNNLLLLKINTESGHAGKSRRFDYLKDVAEELAFIKYIKNL